MPKLLCTRKYLLLGEVKNKLYYSAVLRSLNGSVGSGFLDPLDLASWIRWI